MSIRFLRSCGLALLIACITAIPVFAKGGYAFLTITGSDLKETVRTSETALTKDFFAFADFYRDRVEAPADAGTGYEITRYYMDREREIAFDQLHYYPTTGFVYYDGIINGSSEYDGGWYRARPEMKSMFEALLAGAPIIRPQPVNPETDPANEPGTSQPSATLNRTRPFLPIAVAAGLAAIILIRFSRRKILSQEL
jgi:hypothetical protein